jgi:hypothetical protein
MLALTLFFNLSSQFGDLSGGCASAGLHFNPFNVTHGAPTDPVHHLGDLGNVKADDEGVITFKLTSKEMNLNGPNSIVGCVMFLGLYMREWLTELPEGGHLSYMQ